MTILTEISDAKLHGDLTHSGVNSNSIDSLEASLKRIDSEGKKNIRIDCGGIRAADLSGLRLLYVWMQCFRFRGMEPELVNLSAAFQQAVQKMGLGHCFTRYCAHP